MKKLFKRFWLWLKCEDENGNVVEDSVNSLFDMRYSNLIKRFPLREEITPNDILHISHQKKCGGWETCYITVTQLKEAIEKMRV